MPVDPFSPQGLSADPVTSAVMRPLLTGLSRLRTYHELYKVVSANPHSPFVERALETLRIDCEVSSNELTHVPMRGGVIVAVNHPHGALDGLVMAAILRRRRADVRVLTNRLLERIPD